MSNITTEFAKHCWLHFPILLIVIYLFIKYYPMYILDTLYLPKIHFISMFKI